MKEGAVWPRYGPAASDTSGNMEKVTSAALCLSIGELLTTVVLQTCPSAMASITSVLSSPHTAPLHALYSVSHHFIVGHFSPPINTHYLLFIILIQFICYLLLYSWQPLLLDGVGSLWHGLLVEAGDADRHVVRARHHHRIVELERPHLACTPHQLVH